jgi:hypothetical protein
MTRSVIKIKIRKITSTTPKIIAYRPAVARRFLMSSKTLLAAKVTCNGTPVAAWKVVRSIYEDLEFLLLLYCSDTLS